MSLLPREWIEYIFKFLNPSDLLQTRLVCVLFRDVTQKEWHNLQSSHDCYYLQGRAMYRRWLFDRSWTCYWESYSADQDGKIHFPCGYQRFSVIMKKQDGAIFQPDLILRVWYWGDVCISLPAKENAGAVMSSVMLPSHLPQDMLTTSGFFLPDIVGLQPGEKIWIRFYELGLEEFQYQRFIGQLFQNSCDPEYPSVLKLFRSASWQTLTPFAQDYEPIHLQKDLTAEYLAEWKAKDQERISSLKDVVDIRMVEDLMAQLNKDN